MGFLSHLFKTKFSQPPEGGTKPPRFSEARPDPAQDPEAAESSLPAELADPVESEQIQTIGPGRRISLGAGKPAMPGSSGAGAERKSAAKDPFVTEAASDLEKRIPGISDKEVFLELGDALPRIPAHLLKPGPHDPELPLRFRMSDLFPGISRGRASVPVSAIAKICPGVFREQAWSDQTEIHLPLQKLVEQIGSFQERQPAQPAGKPLAFSNIIVEKGAESSAPTAPVSPAPVMNERPATPPPHEPAPAPASPPPPPPASVPQPAGVVQPVTGFSRSLSRERHPASTGPRPAANPPLASAALERRRAQPRHDKISLSLAALIRGLPEASPLSRFRNISNTIRISLPFAPIEAQLGTGRVEVSLRELTAALPADLKPAWEEIADMAVPIPLDEIFKNLPGPGGAPPPLPEPILPLPPELKVAREAAAITAPVREELPRAGMIPEPESKLEGKAPEPERESKADAKVIDVTSEPKVGSKAPEPEPESKAEAKVLEVKPEPKAESKLPATPELEAKAESKVHEVKPEPKVESSAPEAKIESESPKQVPDAAGLSHPPVPAGQKAEIPSLQRADSVPSAALAAQTPLAAGRSPFVLPPPLLSKLPPPITPTGGRVAAGQEASAEKIASPYDPAILQGVFMTDEELDSQKIANHVAELPGISGCVLVAAAGLTLAGDIPAAFDFKSFRENGLDLYNSIATPAGPMSMGRVENVTLNCANATATLLAEGETCLCVFHRASGFVPGVREKIRIVIEQVGKMP